ncbi:hypothetical protein [Rhodopirellula bahusiensis]|uniref:Uncharacterized protein n=1 Tax=Rhodopirellula bahusiensis TaxID=2014065 RepID=A0A2G1W5E2_9BACT|nr:hypothetical protein [Rhodopirellula bahusiensis]PHQ33859.1 hypothetical protein CEE69_18240 [Rhodopirellula bahusiensis]
MPRVLILIVVAVLLAGVLTPRSAEASCGDWLQHSGGTSMVTSNQSSVRFSERQTGEPGAPSSHELTEGSQGVAGQPVPAKPCDGPLCGQLPTLPIPAPMLPSAERPQHDAVWKEASLRVRVGQFVRRSQEEAADVQQGFLMGIDRPPQATLSLT